MNALATNGSRFNLLPMNVLSREMNRWMDDWTTDVHGAQWAPVSIWESDTHFHLEIDLPGIKVDDVELKVVENVLHVSAHRKQDDNVTYLRQERRFGAWERQFRLPARIDEAGIEAQMTDGVLRVAVPKTLESQVKKIEIKAS